MNPALRSPVFSGQKYVPKGYVLNLPADVESGGVSLADNLAEILKTAQKPSRYYTVQRGDTAGKIARMHHVKLNSLILANNLDRRATVYARQRLRIPQSGEWVGNQSIVQSPTPEDAMARAAAVDSAATPTGIAETIALAGPVACYRRPGPSPADLLAMADIEPQETPPASVAQKLRRKPGIVSAEIGFARIIQVNQQSVGIIQVEVEETLGHYAEWADVRASRIRRLNALPFGQPLHLHQQIKIPLDAVSVVDFETRRYEFHKRLQEDFFAAYRIGELQRYRVQPGDSYWSLCREKFDLPLWLLRRYNAEVNLAALRIHQSLTIPAIESVPQNRPDA